MGKRVSELLDKAIKSFLDVLPNITSHMDSKLNPHDVTKAQVGLSNVDDIRQATKTELDAHKAEFNTHKAEFNTHKNTFGHPAGSVTADKIADYSVENLKLAPNSVSHTKIVDNAVKSRNIDINAVTGDKVASGAVTTIKIADGAVTGAKLALDAVNTDNITDSAVTDTKIGTREIADPDLDTGTVTGFLQALLDKLATCIRAARLRYNKHVLGTDEKHSADDIVYDSNLSVKGKIENLILTEMGGIPDHTHTGDAADVSKISYNNLLDKPKIGVFAIRVAAHNATQREKDAADYVCDGENDEVEIQQAIADLGGSGTVELSSGEFFVEPSLDLTGRVTLIGAGGYTKITSKYSPPEYIVPVGSEIKIININCSSSTFAIYGDVWAYNSLFSIFICYAGSKTILMGCSVRGYITAKTGTILPATAELISQLNEIDINNITIRE